MSLHPLCVNQREREKQEELHQFVDVLSPGSDLRSTEKVGRRGRKVP